MASYRKFIRYILYIEEIMRLLIVTTIIVYRSRKRLFSSTYLSTSSGYVCVIDT